MKTKAFFALLLASFLAHAGPVEDEFLNGGPFEEFTVVADGTPTPFMTGYQPKHKLCQLLTNTAAKQPTGLALKIARLHEAGHCHALRLGLQDINGGVTKYGEAFGDVFVLAWISKHEPENLDRALELLFAERGMNRQVDGAYNTLFVMRRARMSLPSNKDPIQFTVDMLAP
jgi:hypothetical protein